MAGLPPPGDLRLTIRKPRAHLPSVPEWMHWRLTLGRRTSWAEPWAFDLVDRQLRWAVSVPLVLHGAVGPEDLARGFKR